MSKVVKKRAGQNEKVRRDENSLVPNYIRQWREFRGFKSQQSLAVKAGLSANTVHRLESFMLAYTPYTLDALAKVLQCEPGDLVSRDPNQPEAEIVRIYRGLSAKKQGEIVKRVKAIANS